MSGVKGIYYKTDDGNIYKYNIEKDYFLLCTPWKTGEDRRKKKSELNNPVKYNKHKAVFEINEMWRNTKFKWEYNGKKFETRGLVFDDKIVRKSEHTYPWRKEPYISLYTDYTNLFKICPEHKWHHVSDYTSKDGVHHHFEYDDTYYLCMYHGKLIWVVHSQYIPQVYYYKFEGIDIEPKRWSGWTNINCIRPVYCITDKKYI